MTDQLEMRLLSGKAVLVYTDATGSEYRYINGERCYLRLPHEDGQPWCPLCGGHHRKGNGPEGYSCSR